MLTVSASGLGSAGTRPLGELCPGCGMPCSSYLQEPGELKRKVNAASSARVLCQRVKVSSCTGFQMEMQGFSVSVFSLLRLTLREESIRLWAVAPRLSPLCQSKFGCSRGSVLAVFRSRGGGVRSRFPCSVQCVSATRQSQKGDAGEEQGEVTQALHLPCWHFQVWYEMRLTYLFLEKSTKRGSRGLGVQRKFRLSRGISAPGAVFQVYPDSSMCWQNP